MTKFYNLASNTEGSTLQISINDDIGDFWGTTSDDVAKTLNESKDIQNIHVEISSFGGSLFDGISIFNQLKEHKARVKTSITGVAASAASLIFMAGDERVMNTGSFLMIHKPTVGAFADADKMRELADDLDQFQESIVDIYETAVSISRDEIKAMVDKETWINSGDAVEMGFATSKSDEIANIENKYDVVQYCNSFSAEIPNEAKQHFKGHTKNAIQQVLNKLRNVLSINPNENGDDMNKEEVQAMLAEEIGKREVEFSNKLDEVKNTFSSQLTEKDELINALNTKIVDLENKAKDSTIETIVDGFIAEGKISPANRNFEIENLKLREGKDSFETYKNSISSRESVVDFTIDVASNGVDRQSTKNLDDEIEKILNEAGLTTETANQDQYIDAVKKAGVK